MNQVILDATEEMYTKPGKYGLPKVYNPAGLLTENQITYNKLTDQL